MVKIKMNEASQVTVEQLLMQQNMRDNEIKFLRNENARLNAELETSRIIQNQLAKDMMAVSINMRAIATISLN